MPSRWWHNLNTLPPVRNALPGSVSHRNERTCQHNENKILVARRITGTRLFRGLCPEKAAPSGQLQACAFVLAVKRVDISGIGGRALRRKSAH